MHPNPAPPVLPKPSWWKRNWMWFVPAGCLSVLVLATAIIAVLAGAVFGLMKRSDAYRFALSEAQADERVSAVIGSPVGAGFFVTGNVHVSGTSGTAELSIPLRGPEGKATLFVEAQKSAGEWVFSTLVVQFEDGRRIDLRE